MKAVRQRHSQKCERFKKKKTVLNKCIYTSVSKLFRYFLFASTFFSNALTAIFTKCSSTTLLFFSFGLATSLLFFVLSFFSSSWKNVDINKEIIWKKNYHQRIITKSAKKVSLLETYLGPSQTSVMKPFWGKLLWLKVVLFSRKSSIIDVWQGPE